MNVNDTSKGVAEASYLLLVCSYILASASAVEEAREFYRPPSPCLTGASCEHCVDTIEFFHHQVCCYHCRLDNVVINNDICHCIDTRLSDSTYDVGGNCSSGQICDNCAVKISADSSEGLEATPGIRNFCCQDCGLVMPYLYRDEKGCHCEGHSQGRKHQIAPRYDPSQESTTSQKPDTNTCSLSLNSLSGYCVYLRTAFLWAMLFVLWERTCC